MSVVNIEKKKFFEENSKRFVYLERLKKGCAKCGTHGKSYLCFHHRNPQEKLFDISWGVSETRESITREMLDIELEKCDVLCVFCHRRIHKENKNLQGYPYSKKSRLEKLSKMRNLQWKNNNNKE